MQTSNHQRGSSSHSAALQGSLPVYSRKTVVTTRCKRNWYSSSAETPFPAAGSIGHRNEGHPHDSSKRACPTLADRDIMTVAPLDCLATPFTSAVVIEPDPGQTSLHCVLLEQSVPMAGGVHLTQGGELAEDHSHRWSGGGLTPAADTQTLAQEGYRLGEEQHVGCRVLLGQEEVCQRVARVGLASWQGASVLEGS